MLLQASDLVRGSTLVMNAFKLKYFTKQHTVVPVSLQFQGSEASSDVAADYKV